jgi:hypothetical protein
VGLDSVLVVADCVYTSVSDFIIVVLIPTGVYEINFVNSHVCETNNRTCWPL